jgi:hypothetical protein
MDASFGQPAHKQMFRPNAGGGGDSSGGSKALFGAGSTELEGPDEPDEPAQVHEPDAIATMHFLVHAGKMLRSFAKSFPACVTTQMARAHLDNTFPDLPAKIDMVAQSEMKYPLNDKQRSMVTDWINQFHAVMKKKVTYAEKQYEVAQYFQHRKPEAWGFMVSGFKMIGMLGLGQKWSTMSESSRNAMWRYVDLMYRDARQYVGYNALSTVIPPEMRDHIQALLEKNGKGGDMEGMTGEDAKAFFTDMKPEMMQGFISNVFSSPEQTNSVMQSVKDVMGKEAGGLTDFMQTLFK